MTQLDRLNLTGLREWRRSIGASARELQKLRRAAEEEEATTQARLVGLRALEGVIVEFVALIEAAIRRREDAGEL